MKKLQKIAFVAALLALVASDFTFAKASKKVVRIGTAAGTSANFYGNLAVAKELGFVEEEFKKIGYDVEYIGFANGVAVNEALAADDLDIASIGDLPAVTSYANGLDNVWIGTTYAINDKAILVKSDSPISSPQDFTGKTVAYQNGTAYQFVFEKYIQEYKLDKSKIEVSNIAFANGLAALLRGDVDAVIGTYESALAAVKQNEGKIKIIFNTQEKPEWTNQGVLFARGKFLKQNQKVPVALHKALIRAWDEIIKNPDRWYVAVSGQSIAQCPEFGSQLFNVDGGKFQNYSPEITDDLIKKLQSLYDFFKEIGRLPVQKDVHGLADNSYYLKAKKELKR